jgi:glycosyltransferase involved in cell wall biosynthesis
LHIIENWSDGGAVLPKPTEQSDLRARLGLQEHFIAAYSGNLGRAHDIDTLLEAAHELRADPGFEFLIIGGGAKMLALEQHARASGLTSFHFLPYQPRDALADSLAAADVHLASLLPDLEGLIVPSKMYGILAAGRPAVFIGDPDGELARLIGQTQCGASVRCGDGRRLAQILRDLRRDRDERLQMGARARAVFEKRFTVDHAAEKWVQLLRGLGARERRVGAPAASAVTR